MGELGLDPLEAVPDGGLELSFHGEDVIGGDAPLAFELGIGGAGEAVPLPARPVEAVGVGPALVPELTRI